MWSEIAGNVAVVSRRQSLESVGGHESLHPRSVNASDVTGVSGRPCYEEFAWEPEYVTDNLSKEQRSHLMSKIRGGDTNPEWILRCGLHRVGLRYALRSRRLPGRPDLSFPAYRSVVFVHGCYWHRHPRCKDASMPKSNVDFWQEKFAANVARDNRDVRALRSLGWRVVVVWECELVNRTEASVERVAAWVRRGGSTLKKKASGEKRPSREKKVPTRRLLLGRAASMVRERVDEYDKEGKTRSRRASADESATRQFAIVDLFSGAGGMSFGFHKHRAFKVVAAADAEIGKPSTGNGKLQCNDTYSRNIGITPAKVDLGSVSPADLRRVLSLPDDMRISVLSACPPCTGFSRVNPENHMRDDRRNSLVRRSAEFAVALSVDIVVMENARELIRGNFKHHYEWFREYLEKNGYNVFGRTYMLSRFGLPQDRERAIVVAARQELPLHTLESLWDGWGIRHEALTVRRTFDSIPKSATARGVHPSFSDEIVRRRIAAIPADGGSWVDLLRRSDAAELLTDSMKRIVKLRRFGSYPDVYGRMAWDKPAQTIKRECSHIGNGRYAHPAEDRLCSVREMAALQGFPSDFVFGGRAVSNMYRHIGDAVPPLISFQIAHLCRWILTGDQPAVRDVLLPGTNLRAGDVVRVGQQGLFDA